MTTEVPIPATVSPDALVNLVHLCNQTYDQCVFSVQEGEFPCVKIISTSSRQRDQARTLLPEELVKIVSLSPYPDGMMNPQHGERDPRPAGVGTFNGRNGATGMNFSPGPAVSGQDIESAVTAQPHSNTHQTGNIYNKIMVTCTVCTLIRSG